MGAEIDVVLPVLDEEEALGWVLGAMPAGYRPIVVDNGSTDASVEVAVRHGAEVVRANPKGFGSACWVGLNCARSGVVCFMDADGSLDPAELARVSIPVSEGEADLCLGRRAALPGSFPLHARAGNSVLAWRVRRTTGAPLRDIGPMRAVGREALLGLGMVDRRFGWPLEMVVRAAAAGWRIAEVDVTYSARRGGKSKVSGTWSGTLRTVRDMWKFVA